jgi:hypothetical protein
MLNPELFSRLIAFEMPGFVLTTDGDETTGCPWTLPGNDSTGDPN